MLELGQAVYIRSMGCDPFPSLCEHDMPCAPAAVSCKKNDRLFLLADCIEL